MFTWLITKDLKNVFKASLYGTGPSMDNPARVIRVEEDPVFL